MSSGSATRQTSNTPILDRLAPVPAPILSKSSSSKDSQRGLLIAMSLLLLTVGWIAAMIWLPAVRELSSRIVEPANKALEASTARMFSVTDTVSFLISALSWVVVFFLALSAAIAAHELGHLIAGWSAHFRFVSIRVGRILVDASFRLSLSHDLPPRPLGLTRMVPIGAKAIRLRTLVMLLGGSALNLLSGMCILVLANTHSEF